MKPRGMSFSRFVFFHGRMRSLILLGLLMSLSQTQLSPAYAGSAWDSYTAGLKAMEAGDCIAAKKYFIDAIDKDPQDRKIRRGMFFDYYQPNAKLKELGPCLEQMEIKSTQPVRIVFLNPAATNAKYPCENKTVEAKWRVTGGSGQYSVTLDGNPVTADSEGLYTSSLALETGENTFIVSAYDKERKRVESVELQLTRHPPQPICISLMSPATDKEEYPYETETVEAKWRISGGSGHFLVTVNGKPVTTDAEEFYSSELSLEPGENAFDLSVFDKEFNNVENIKLHLKRLPPPPLKIAFLTPESGRAEYPFEDETIDAKWLITGGSGQYSVTMDGKPVTANAEGLYTASLSLEPGENSFHLNVLDKEHNKIQSTTLLLERQPPPPLQILLLNPIAATARYPYENNQLELKWRLTGGSGQATVTVNGTPASKDKSGLYSFMFPMKEGENIVEVVAFDNKLGPDKAERLRLMLTRMEPPPLELSIADDLQDVRTNNDSIIVQGKAAGMVDGGTLTVNGTLVDLMGDGRFEYLTPLAEGDNDLKIRLEDGLKRIKTASVHVTRSRNPLAGVDVGNFYALIIGNNDYQDPQIHSLETPINDARTIGKILKENYGFNVKILENATRHEIILEFNEFRKMLTERDNFLIYYAGHGVMDKAEDEGYWLPVDAKKEIDDKWIPNSTISNKMRALKAKHILLVTDSCYSGTLTKTRDIAIRKKGAGYLKEIVEKKSRLVLTSGGEEPVSDEGGRKGHSVFASGFLKEIEDNDQILEAADLYMNVKKYVRNAKDQVPAFSELPKTGHELGGDFLFIRKK